MTEKPKPIVYRTKEVGDTTMFKQLSKCVPTTLLSQNRTNKKYIEIDNENLKHEINKIVFEYLPGHLTLNEAEVIACKIYKIITCPDSILAEVKKIQEDRILLNDEGEI